MHVQEKHILVHNMPQGYIRREVTERGILYCIADNLVNIKLVNFLIGDLYQIKKPKFLDLHMYVPVIISRVFS